MWKRSEKKSRKEKKKSGGGTLCIPAVLVLLFFFFFMPPFVFLSLPCFLLFFARFNRSIAFIAYCQVRLLSVSCIYLLTRACLAVSNSSFALFIGCIICYRVPSLVLSLLLLLLLLLILLLLLSLAKFVFATAILLLLFSRPLRPPFF